MEIHPISKVKRIWKKIKEKLRYLRNMTSIFLVKTLTSWFIPTRCEKYYMHHKAKSHSIYTLSHTHKLTMNKKIGNSAPPDLFGWVY